LELCAPLAAPGARRGLALLDFARGLRRLLSKDRTSWPWGVIGCPADSDLAQERELRAAGSELFERLLLVDEPLLLGMGLLEDPLHQHALAIDVGASGTRASLVGGLAEGGPGTAHLPGQSSFHGGGGAVDQLLKSLLQKKYSD